MEWIKSERYQKMEKLKQKEREKNNPMKQCVLKFDHFENIHRYVVVQYTSRSTTMVVNHYS